MSFDEYAEHIYQKHRLCIALAVLKTKPLDLPSLQYLEQLKSKMADNMDDDDITICSDDFVMDYDNDANDSITILKDFDIGNCDDEMENGGLGFIGDGSQESNIDEQPTPYLPEELSQTTFYNSSQSQTLPTTNNPITDDVTLCETQNNTGHHIKNNIPDNKNNTDITELNISTISNKELGTKDVLKTTDTITKPIIIQKYANTNKLNIPIISNNSIINNTPKDTNIDSQKTILYTVPNFTQNNTHYSASQGEMVIPNKYLHGTNKIKYIATVEKPTHLTNVEEINNTDINSANTNLQSNGINTKSSKANITNNTIQEKKFESTIGLKKNIPNANSANNLGDTQNVNKISQINNDGVHLNQNVSNIKSTEIQKSKTKYDDATKQLVISNQRDLEYSQNLDDYFNEIQSYIDKDLRNKNDENTISFQCGNERITSCTQDTDMTNDTQIPISYPDRNPKDTQAYNKEEVIPKQNVKKVTENKEFDEEFPQTNENTEELGLVAEESESVEIVESVEVIPYKVLGELSKVKTYLKRRDRRMSCDGFSTDSGYRSDSQVRSSSRGALQLSGISMNQSAYSLLNHIVQCPLVAATRDITAEIAQALGQLINKLHEEETYPPFLEELLDTVDILLRQVFKGAVSDHTEFLKKDEFLERLLFLNKSIHIQKHTITKITNMLTKFHEKLSDESVTYELTNIDEIENSSYIFHILEILLKKYIKNKTLSSQSNTQLSQDDEKILKKSAITDIWRRKWNPNLKESNEGSRENRCVLKSCSDILNRIVVDCVNSYSLVAFSALRCFNSMQS